MNFELAIETLLTEAFIVRVSFSRLSAVTRSVIETITTKPSSR